MIYVKVTMVKVFLVYNIFISNTIIINILKENHQPFGYK